MLDQVLFCPPCYRRFDAEQAMFYENSNSIEDRVIGTVQIQNIQIFRVHGVTVCEPVTQRGDGPFFSQVDAFCAVEAKAEVIVLSAKSEDGNLHDLL
jgi:hypothetical protein